jgi:hypothetical protein
MKIDLEDINSYRKFFNVDNDITAFSSIPCYNLNLPNIEHYAGYKQPFLFVAPNYASIQFYRNGNKLNGLFYYHNLNGPAFIHFDSCGIINEVYYMVENKQHNPHGPARTVFRKERKLLELYFLNGKKHNSTGPAYISYHNDCVNCDYYFNDLYITKENFFNRLEDRKENVC